MKTTPFKARVSTRSGTALLAANITAEDADVSLLKGTEVEIMLRERSTRAAVSRRYIASIRIDDHAYHFDVIRGELTALQLN